MRLLFIAAWFTLFFNCVYANVTTALLRQELEKLKAQIVELQTVPRHDLSANRDMSDARRAPNPDGQSLPHWTE
jgi:hypothetical protein